PSRPARRRAVRPSLPCAFPPDAAARLPDAAIPNAYRVTDAPAALALLWFPEEKPARSSPERQGDGGIAPAVPKRAGGAAAHSPKMSNGKYLALISAYLPFSRIAAMAAFSFSASAVSPLRM